MNEQERTKKYQDKLSELKAKRQRKDFWSPKPGPKGNSIRILPNWNGEAFGDWYRETAYHRKLGTEAEKSAVCLLREGHENCPVCSEVKKLYQTKNKEDAELAKKIKAQVRVLYNIVDLEEPDKGVVVWMSGVDVLEQLLAYYGNPKYGELSDPEKGRNITVYLTEGKNTKSGYNEYNVQPDPDRTEIANPEWLGLMVDLDSMVKPISSDELEALLKGLPPPEEKEEKPVSKKETKPEEISGTVTIKSKPEPKSESKPESPKEEVKKSNSIQEMLAKVRKDREAKK